MYCMGRLICQSALACIKVKNPQNTLSKKLFIFERFWPTYFFFIFLEWLQVDLLSPKCVTGFEIKGRARDYSQQFVTSLYFWYSVDDISWKKAVTGGLEVCTCIMVYKRGEERMFFVFVVTMECSLWSRSRFSQRFYRAGGFACISIIYWNQYQLSTEN